MHPELFEMTGEFLLGLLQFESELCGGFAIADLEIRFGLDFELLNVRTRGDD